MMLKDEEGYWGQNGRALRPPVFILTSPAPPGAASDFNILRSFYFTVNVDVALKRL